MPDARLVAYVSRTGTTAAAAAWLAERVLTMTTACSPFALRTLGRDIVAAGGRCLGVHALRVAPGDALPDLLTPILTDLRLP